MEVIAVETLITSSAIIKIFHDKKRATAIVSAENDELARLMSRPSAAIVRCTGKVVASNGVLSPDE